jgi:hypothetical protein
VLEAKFRRGSAGRNLPWLGWRMESLNLRHSADATEFSFAEADKINDGTNVTLSVSPIAVLDERGRVMVGGFPIGAISVQNPQDQWQGEVLTPAQMKWSSRFMTPEAVSLSVKASMTAIDRASRENTLSFRWDSGSSEFPPKLSAEMGATVPLKLRVSSGMGKPTGDGRNPAFIYTLEFTDSEGQLNLRLDVQNNLQDLIGWPLIFGSAGDSAQPFESGHCLGNEPLEVRFGVGSMLGFPLQRTVPQGWLLIKSLETNARGHVVAMDATIDFHVNAWADVHPGGHVTGRLTFAKKSGRPPSKRVNPCERSLSKAQ